MAVNKRIRQIRSARRRIRRKATNTNTREPDVKISELPKPKGADTRVTIGMASIPEREPGMVKAITVLLPQCDELHVSLNGYSETYAPPISDTKLFIHHNPRGTGPASKFIAAGDTHRGYYLSVDDDLAYPSDYVQKMVGGIEKYKREAIIGFHGMLYTESRDSRATPYRCLFPLVRGTNLDLPMHTLGSGVMGYHSSCFKIDWKSLLPGKIDDQIAARAQDAYIPTILLQHPQGWMDADTTLHRRGHTMCRDNKALSASWRRVGSRDWKIYLPSNWKQYNN